MIERAKQTHALSGRRVAYVLLTTIMAAAVSARVAAQSTHEDPQNGQRLFVQRCALCHEVGASGAGSGQGPNLSGVVGRKAASEGGFPYTQALRAAGLVWNASTLERFLAAPMRVVPGTSMPIAVPNDAERRDIVAYLATLPDISNQFRTGGRQKSPPAGVTGQAVKPTAVASVYSDWRGDNVGAARRIEPDDLPAPFITSSARNSPTVVDPPASAQLRVPDGFTVHQFASGLEGPRILRVAPNGDIFVAETRAGRVRVLRAAGDSQRPATMTTFAEDLDQPFGIAFYPRVDPQWVYVANNNAVVRFPYRAGDMKARDAAEVVIPQLSESSAGHSTRDIAFSNDDKRMFISVGSASNVAEDLPEKNADEIRRWETLHGLGAAWGYESRRADVLVYEPDGRDGRVFATGIRNCVGLAVNPASGDLWCATNERDGLGDDLVPDYATRVQAGAFYGWPWYYIGANQDPRHHGARPDLAERVTVPDVLFQPHSAPLALAFYSAGTGAAAFPAEYAGDAFVAFHGSWNRSTRTGYKVVRVRLKDGVATGEYEDFLTGFVANDQHVWGRPVGVAVARDGALIVSEDGNNTLWRITYDRR